MQQVTCFTCLDFRADVNNVNPGIPFSEAIYLQGRYTADIDLVQSAHGKPHVYPADLMLLKTCPCRSFDI